MALKKRRPGLVYPTGEDWHYVGSGGGEPAFETGWSNASSSFPAMAFRLREVGIVDLVGNVTTDGTEVAIFVLPTGYRPISGTVGIMPYTRSRSAANSGQLLQVTDTGSVVPTDGHSPGDIDYIAGSFFLIPPDNG